MHAPLCVFMSLSFSKSYKIVFNHEEGVCFLNKPPLSSLSGVDTFIVNVCKPTKVNHFEDNIVFFILLFIHCLCK